MSDISWRLGSFDAVLIVLVLCSPGFFIGLVLGAFGNPKRRVVGAFIGAVVGTALAAAYLYICLNSKIVLMADGFNGGLTESFRIGWPGFIAGAVVGSFLNPTRRVVASLCGAAFGFILWLGVWAAFF